MNIDTIRQKYRTQILAIAEKYGAENVRVFGSIARGNETEDSDLDLLVHLRPETSLMDVAGMWGEMSDLLGRKVDIVSEATIPSYANHIFAEAKPL